MENIEPADPDIGKFPKTSLLESDSFPVEKLAELALREGQRTNPLYRVHRWFARRLGSAFRSLLVGVSTPEDEGHRFWEKFFSEVDLNGAVVLDPFVGGGTSVVEASRLNARIAACDIDPVAAVITRFELQAAHCSSLGPVLLRLREAVGSLIEPLHATTLDSGEEAVVLHHFWVNQQECPKCNLLFEVHPHYQLARDPKRHRQWAFCRCCHAIQELPLSRKRLDCEECGSRTLIRSGTLQRSGVTCPRCRFKEPLSARGQREKCPPSQRLFAQEYLLPPLEGERHYRRGFRRVDKADIDLYEEASKRLSALLDSDPSLVPRRKIPVSGRMDRRPLIHGFSRYSQLFNDRQLLHLASLAQELRKLPEAISSDAARLAFSEHLAFNCLLTSYAFDYRRLSGLFSIHAFRHISRPVELNPWLEGIGRGTFPNALRKITKAVEFAQAPSDLHPEGNRGPVTGTIGVAEGKVENSFSAWNPETSQAVIVVDSADRLADMAPESVDLVLTDPPYCDNVSYSELSDFYLAWHQVLGIAPAPYDDLDRHSPIGANLAASARRGAPLDQYELSLSTILARCERVLRPSGVLVFTYHHVSPGPWNAVANALHSSGFRCTRVFPLRGEGRGGLHSHAGTIKWDAVLVCRKNQMAHSEDVLLSPKDAFDQAYEEVKTWRFRLKEPGLGFRDPDALNLLRAILIASTSCEGNGNKMKLLEALKSSHPPPSPLSEKSLEIS